jgi:hypothetical protein
MIEAEVYKDISSKCPNDLEAVMFSGWFLPHRTILSPLMRCMLMVCATQLIGSLRHQGCLTTVAQFDIVYLLRKVVRDVYNVATKKLPRVNSRMKMFEGAIVPSKVHGERYHLSSIRSRLSSMSLTRVRVFAPFH